MKVIVTGGRAFADGAFVAATLGYLHAETPFTRLAQGGATGADELARSWARRAGIEVKTYPANWARYGAGAGPVRNKEMLVREEPDLVVAFPGGKGTANMVALAREHDVPLIEARPARGPEVVAEKRLRQINVRMNDEEARMLTELMAATGETAGVLIRRWLRAMHKAGGL